MNAAPSNQPPDPNGPMRSGTGKNVRRPAPRPGLMHNLGQFVGHLMQGIKSNPAAESESESQAAHSPHPPPTVRHEVIERIQDTPTGPVKIRRTIIEEVHEPVTGGGEGGAPNTTRPPVP